LLAQASGAGSIACEVRVEDATCAWGSFGLLLAVVVVRLFRSCRPISSWSRWRLRRERERLATETRTHHRVPLALQERRARALGYSTDPVNWDLEPIDWRNYPLPVGAIEGLYNPEHVASSFRELEGASSREAAQAAISRLEHALGVPEEFVVYPAALPASRRLLGIVLDAGARDWARWAAASVLTTLLDEPHPGIHFAGPDDDSLPRTHQGIVRAVQERTPDLRELVLGTGRLAPRTCAIIRHVLELARTA
jgi:hypothetical protein